VLDAGRLHAWATFDALTASAAGIEHAVNTSAQGGFEAAVTHWLQAPMLGADPITVSEQRQSLSSRLPDTGHIQPTDPSLPPAMYQDQCCPASGADDIGHGAQIAG